MKSTPSKTTALLLTTSLVAAFSLSIANLAAWGKELEVKTNDQHVKATCRILLRSCADCHTAELTNHPFYFHLPVAHGIISKDIKEAQSKFVLYQGNLDGTLPLNEAQLARIKNVLLDGSMPPLRYKAAHWRSIISNTERSQLLTWIKEHCPNDGLKPIPTSSPFHVDYLKVELGKRLFNDKHLSGNNTVSCASCHLLDKGGTDQSIVATGIHGQKGSINTPTVLNAVFNFVQFWDGRAANLQAQASGPINNPIEMGSSWQQVISYVNSNKFYATAFHKSYPNGVTADSITDAIAVYETTLLTPNSRFDRFLNGDKTALSQDEQNGYHLFLDNNCASCHTGVNFGGQTYEKMGKEKDYFAWRGSYTKANNGRFNVTHNLADMHKFKVPTLRNIAYTSPYFHDGSAKDLKTAVLVMSEFQVGKKLSDHDAELIVQFLKTLTGNIARLN